MKLAIPSCVSHSPFPYANAPVTDHRHRAQAWASACIGVGSGTSADTRACLDLSANSQLIELLGFDSDSSHILPALQWEQLNTCESSMASSPAQRPSPPDTPEIIQQVLEDTWEPGIASSPAQRPPPPDTPEIIRQVLEDPWEPSMVSSPAQRPPQPKTPEIIKQVLAGKWQPGMVAPPAQRPPPVKTPEIIHQAVRGKWKPDMASGPARHLPAVETPGVNRQAVQRTWIPAIVPGFAQPPTFPATQEITWGGGGRTRPTSQDSSSGLETTPMLSPKKNARRPTRAPGECAKVTNAVLEEWKALDRRQIEREGGIKGFALKRNLSYHTFRKCVCASGGLKPRGERWLRAHKKEKVTDAMLAKWEVLSAEQIEEGGGVRGFAEKHNVSRKTLQHWVYASGGLNQYGKDRVYRNERNPVTNAMLEEWKTLDTKQIENVGGIPGFATKHNAPLKVLAVYLDASGGLTRYGDDRLHLHEKNPITDALLEEWNALSTEQRQQEDGIKGFALKRNVAVATLKTYARMSGGLSDRGHTRLKNNKKIQIADAMSGA